MVFFIPRIEEQMTDSVTTKPALPVAEEATVWEKPACPQCMGAKLGLKAQGVTPAIKSLVTDPAALALFKASGFASAPILQFPAVVDGDEVLFEATTVAGNQVDVIGQYGAAVKELAARQQAEELVAA